MEKDGGKKEFWGFLTEKYLILSAAAAVMGIAAGTSLGMGTAALWEALPAAILICTALWSNLRLKKKGVYHSGRKEARKSADPRVMGTVGDISGVGCMAAALMGISVLFSEMYFKDGGIFGLDNYMPPLFLALSKALQITSAVGMLTSREWSEALLYNCAAETLKIAGGECCKKFCRIGNYPGIMKKTGSVLAARLAVGIGFAAAEAACAVSGGGLPYGTVWTALLSALTLIVTESACFCDDKTRTEDKHRLINKSRKNFCILNSVLFAAAAFFFLFSFPIRSVFTAYEVIHNFDYHVEVTGKVEAVLVPYGTDENASLFTGFFLVSGGYIIVCCAAACAEGKDIVSGISRGKAPGAVLFCIAVIAAVTVIHGRIFPAAALDGLMTMVCISMVCLFTAVNLGALLLRKT